MQYKNATKIIIDKRKLEILIRLGCPDEVLLGYIKTGKYKKTNDKLVDEILESLIDFKDFKNWGGNHNPNGINGCNKKKNLGQVDRQVENTLDSQVVDKDIDIDKDLNRNKEYILCKITEQQIEQKMKEKWGV